MHIASSRTPDEFWARQSALDERVRQRFSQWPCFALSGWGGSRMIDEWSFGDGSYRSFRFDDGVQPSIVVATDSADTGRPAQHLLLNLPTGDAIPTESDAARSDRLEKAGRPPSGSVDIAVEGETVPFDTWQSGPFTVAESTVGDLVIGLRWTGQSHLALHLVDDIEPYLEGRRRHIRNLRLGRGLDS